MPEETNKSKPTPKLCPFTKEDCLKDGCALWASVVINTQKRDMCAVCAIIMAIAMSKPPAMMQMPGGLGGPPQIFKG